MKPNDSDFDQLREQMVVQQLKGRDIVDPKVLKAMSQVPRHEFVPQQERSSAYIDSPLPIGFGQTISQPYIVALMTQLISPQKSDRALDVGSGSGYQAAILGSLCAQVYGIELVPELAHRAQQTIARLGHHNIVIRAGDGYLGDPDHAPFDVIVVAAAAPILPQALIDQLKPGGRMVIPIGQSDQSLVLYVKNPNTGKIEEEVIAPVRFVPMIESKQYQSLRGQK